ncbi:hypothetical protein [Legionella waltersii]|uniref:Uncharacterized protein n=1 Tax=Legionella waltersii TaxID=66969 RepID=A0A0W1A2Z3_9GAMM|nr:hypothetical protein [Legionella waltersii]KTD75536.1 hypothetical protein Lwal_2474 [Legionella waltersii]SNU98552.1 Uncharacterised protein [Legionella waltersii]
MSTHSTSKMLARMHKNPQSEKLIDIDSKHPQLDDLDSPQLKPEANMENVLTNILGASFTNKPSPMD